MYIFFFFSSFFLKLLETVSLEKYVMEKKKKMKKKKVTVHISIDYFSLSTGIKRLIFLRILLSSKLFMPSTSTTTW